MVEREFDPWLDPMIGGGMGLLADESRYNLYEGTLPGTGEPPPPAPRQAEAWSYKPTTRERAAAYILGNNPSTGRRRFTEGLMGSSGLPGSERLGLVDFVPFLGAGLQGQETYQNTGDVTTAAAAMFPGMRGARLGGKAAKKAGQAIIGELVEPPPGIGHNMPPAEYSFSTWTKELPRPKPPTRATEIPNIRNLSVDEATDAARRQAHLIKSGEQSEGFYVGAPRDIQSKVALNKARQDFDDYVAADPRGGDWYDRYRAAMAEVTGNDPKQNLWASNQHGQWSAGVDPGSELQFVLRENNAAIAGMPVKAARPAQHEAHMAALAANDPSLYQLGDKTSEYARLINASQIGRQQGATGVNDFRHARNWGYTEASGNAQRDALTPAQHTFLDYETALAVDRANKAKLGGRDNWTGEQLQAAPWVRQKAEDIRERAGKDADGNFKITYEEAFNRANKQTGDYYPKHTYSATYEVQPGAIPARTGHQMGSLAMTPDEKVMFANDPLASWSTLAPGGRDSIYSGLGVPGTDSFMRVRPTLEAQGMYRNAAGELETNPAFVARPLGAFQTPTEYSKEFIGPRPYEPFRSVPPAERAILNAGEGTRALFDAQEGGGWHKLFAGGPAGESNSLLYPRQGKAALGDILGIQGQNTPYGLSDAVDRGEGIVSTRFWPKPEGGKEFNKALRQDKLLDPAGISEPQRVRLEGNLVDYTDEWKAGVGSQEVTKKWLGYLNVTPELRAAFNNNPYIPQEAARKLERNVNWTDKIGAPREDLQNLLAEIAKGGNDWVDRVEALVKKGAIYPGLAAAFFAAAAESQKEGPGREGL